MSAFVLDCSVAIAWCIEDEVTPETDLLLDRAQAEGASVPGLWPLELGNVLLVAVRRGRLSAMDVTARLAIIAELPIRIDSETAARALHDILALARTERLTTYDAAYLELAMREGLPLATRDRDLARAAERTGVELLLPA